MMGVVVLGTILGFVATGSLVAIAVGISAVVDELADLNENIKRRK